MQTEQADVSCARVFICVYDFCSVHLYDLHDVLDQVARAPFVAVVATVVSVATVVCDQVVPVQHVDDIDEVHQLDPVHQVDHKDEHHKDQ